MSSSEFENEKPKRRSVTSITLGWIADRLRRTEKIKAELSAGRYMVDSEKVAQSIINKEGN